MITGSRFSFSGRRRITPATRNGIRQALADQRRYLETLAADVRALPTVFIGNRRFAGAGYSAAELLAAIVSAS